jgi:hypothetical protein
MHTVFRLICVLILIVISATLLSAQNLDKQISGVYYDQNFNEVLKDIQLRYNFKFAFDEKRLSEIIVDREIKKTPLKTLLWDYLNPNGLSYLILDNTIIIKPKEEIPGYEEKKPEVAYTLSGYVYDSLSGERLPFALVSFTPGNITTTSNEEGFFSIRDIAVDSGSILVHYLGYRKKYIRIESLLEKPFLKVSLRSNNAVLDEVLVEGFTNELVNLDNDVSKMSINPAQMENLPNLGEVDVFRSIQLLPGINGTFETASSINIRGSAPDHNLILFDGFNVYHLDHFFGIFSAFNNNSIKNIKLYKGGFEAKYGGRVGGVLDITGKTGNSEKPEFGLGVNFIGLNALAEVPLSKKTTLFVSGRRSLTDIFPTQSYKDLIVNVLNNDLNTEVTAKEKSYEELDPIFNFYDLNAKISHRFSDSELLSVSLYHGRDLLRIDNSSDFQEFNFSTENRTRWGNIGVGLSYNRQWEENFYTDFSFGYSNYFSRVSYGASKEFLDENEDLDELIFFEQKNDVDDVSLRIDNGWNYSGNNELEFGIWTTNNIISYTVFRDSIFSEDLSESGNQTAGYVQNRFRIGGRAEIVPGIRINYFDLTNDVFIEPRFNINYRIHEKLLLKGAYGKYTQVVSRVLRRNVFASNPDFWILSDDENIPVLKSDHLIGGFRIDFTDLWAFDVEAYQKWDRGVLEYIPPEGIFANSAPEYSPYFRGSGESRGIEFLLQKKGKNYNGWISYALSRSENKFEELNENEKYPSSQDQRHEVKFVNIYNFKKFEFSAVWIYGTGRPYTAPLGNFDVETPDGNALEVLYVSDINSFRLPDYHRLDISVNYRFEWSGMRGQVGASLFNVYNRKNVKYRRFFRLDEDFETGESPIGNTDYIQRDLYLLGITPNLSFELKF